MTSVLTLARKMERALRNGTGFNVTADEMWAMADAGVIDTIHGAKMKELKARCPAKPAPTSSETSGSTSAETEPVTIGKSPPIGPEAARSYIEALSAAA